jgi:hypothetical protein
MHHGALGPCWSRSASSPERHSVGGTSRHAGSGCTKAVWEIDDIVDVIETRDASAQGVGVPLLYNDAEHWRKRAKEARALAEKMSDAVNKKAMMEVAEKYDDVAARAAERLAQRTRQSK